VRSRVNSEFVGELLMRCALMLAVGLTVVFLPRAFDDYFNYRLALVGIYFISIVGLNVVTGYNGQLTLGHGAFMAFGAYATTVLTTEYGVSVYWTIPVAGLVTGVFGLLFGFPALRLSGVYLALATFGLAVSVPLVAKRASGWTGGSAGKVLPLPQSPIGSLSTNQWLSYLTWAIGACLYVAAWIVLRGRFGRAFRAVRDAPIAAVAAGLSLARIKTLAFAISAAYAGVAGALLAIAIAFVNPDTFPVSLSILLLTGAVVGGLGSLEGMLFGAVFIQFVPKWSESINNHAPTVMYGLILLGVLLVAPGGAAQVVSRLIVRLKQTFRPLYSRTSRSSPATQRSET
jgi:branched-chain amino acid transport system permease protein